MRFLFTTQASNDIGLLTRTLPIALELKRRGHTVAFCNPARAPRKVIAEAGFENLLPKLATYHLNPFLFSSQPDLVGAFKWLASKRVKDDFGGWFGFLRQLIRSRPRMGSATADIWSVDHLAALTGMLGEDFVRTECAGLAQLIEDYRADAVVDSMHPLACIAARASRRPLVTVLQADMHPASKGFLWWKEPPPRLPTPTPILNQVLAEYGLAPIRKTEDLFVADLTLVLGMPETDPLPAEADATYVGAILWQSPDATPPDWFTQLDDARPVVWVYSGNPRYLPFRTPIDSSVVIRACVSALADENAQVILTSGYHALPKDLLPLPKNFRHAPYVPGLLMARRADLMIHHGGYGSCQAGLYCGTPAAIIPTYSERESNARRVRAVGAGEFLAPSTDETGRRKRVPPGPLRALARQVLASASYSENARRVSAALQTFGGAAYAVDLIEGLAPRR